MVDNHHIAILTQMNTLASRFGLKPQDFLFVIQDNEEAAEFILYCDGPRMLYAAFSSPPPSQERKPVQVIYVTHSPFLIDKNHSERIRVLEKGVDDEGTRVVRNVSKNHYEPLRSAFGALVGETTFIGNCNLVVEGPADQILLAGVCPAGFSDV